MSAGVVLNALFGSKTDDVIAIGKRNGRGGRICGDHNFDHILSGIEGTHLFVVGNRTVNRDDDVRFPTGLVVVLGLQFLEALDQILDGRYAVYKNEDGPAREQWLG
jgi:hypothetical protein